MKGDFSRKTSSKAIRKHYSGVLKQQGRVQLDADWNEFNSITDHQRSVRTIDIIGQCGAPVHHSGFRIMHPGAGLTDDLLISTGRFYAGGLLCETAPSSKLPVTKISSNSLSVDDTKIDGLHIASDDWVLLATDENPDGIMAKVTEVGNGTIKLNSNVSAMASDRHPYLRRLLLFSRQVDRPDAGSYTAVAGQTDLFYLDVWERHITTIEDPELREVALGGPDTDTRSKIIAQVKFLTDVGNIACGDYISKWDIVTKAPNGRLSTRTVVPESPDNPCQLGESGGFLGLENRLYRVEIHDPGQGETGPSFKWSRDNASHAYAISEFFDVGDGVVYKKISLRQNGKDEILRIRELDWIEVYGDHTGLNTDGAGTLAQVLKVEGLILTLDRDIAAHKDEPFPKIRRWDTSNQRPDVLTSFTPGTSYQLEDGIVVEFSGSEFRAGNYWCFSARTLTGEIEVLDKEPPMGIKHHYCRLALVTGLADGSLEIEDCRPAFTPLTEIDDCDLREHNKFLHGYGVVCGLKMICIAERNGVMIEKGYALDCEGNPIRIKQPMLYDILAQPQVQEHLKKNKGYGAFCLSIANGSNKKPAISIEPYIELDFWDRVLEGTLLKDFYDDCILSLIDFLKKQFPESLHDDVPVSEQQQRLTSFINLAAQLINSESGPYGFISGKEHEYMLRFYNDLKQKIASETFCGMFDGDDPFPEYPLDDGLNTIFGSPLRAHHKLRLHPENKYAYTCGRNNKVCVYDLEEGALIHSIDFPTTDVVGLQDIAISRDGKQLFAVGISVNDSIFAMARIDGSGKLSWISPSIAREVKYVSLAIGRDNELYATAKARGLHLVHGIGTTAFTTRPISKEFNATGLLHISNDGQHACAAESNSPVGTESNVFDRVRIINLLNQTTDKSVDMGGNDVANDIITFGNYLFVTGNQIQGTGAPSSNQRVLVAFNRFDLRQKIATAIIDDRQNTFLRLAVFDNQEFSDTPYVLVSSSDRMKVVRVPVNPEQINPEAFRVDENFRIPVQLFPMQIVLNTQASQAYTVNMLVNTLTSIDLERTFRQGVPPNYSLEPPDDLANYRDKVIALYRNMVMHLLQSLKDCFCDKFLVDCPECGEKEKVYLGCVEIRENKVYHICNFSKRRYVKTFPTVEYWLSTVPVLPLLSEAIGKFCCTVLDLNLFNFRKKDHTDK